MGLRGRRQPADRTDAAGDRPVAHRHASRPERGALPAPADWQRLERRSGAAAVQSDPGAARRQVRDDLPVVPVGRRRARRPLSASVCGHPGDSPAARQLVDPGRRRRRNGDAERPRTNTTGSWASAIRPSAPRAPVALSGLVGPRIRDDALGPTLSGWMRGPIAFRDAAGAVSLCTNAQYYLEPARPGGPHDDPTVPPYVPARVSPEAIGAAAPRDGAGAPTGLTRRSADQRIQRLISLMRSTPARSGTAVALGEAVTDRWSAGNSND